MSHAAPHPRRHYQKTVHQDHFWSRAIPMAVAIGGLLGIFIMFVNRPSESAKSASDNKPVATVTRAADPALKAEPAKTTPVAHVPKVEIPNPVIPKAQSAPKVIPPTPVAHAPKVEKPQEVTAVSANPAPTTTIAATESEKPSVPPLADAKVGQTFWITPLRVIMDGTEWKLWVDATETPLATSFYDKQNRLKSWSATVVATDGDTGMVEITQPEGLLWFFPIDPYAGQALTLKSPDGGSPIRLGLARTVLKHKYWKVLVRYSDGRTMEVVPRDQRPARLCEAVEGQECWISQHFVYFGTSLRTSKEPAYWAAPWAPISSSARKDDLGPWVKIRPKVGSHLQWATTFHEADLLSDPPNVQDLNWSDTVVSDLMVAIYWVRWWQADRTKFVSPACISLCPPDGQRAPNRRPK